MMTTVLFLAFCILTLAILCGLVRLARGPLLIDRIMAFDLVTTATVGMIVLLSIQWKTPLYLELILIFSLLGFCGTVAFVYYLRRTFDLDRPRAASGSEPSPLPTDTEHD